MESGLSLYADVGYGDEMAALGVALERAKADPEGQMIPLVAMAHVTQVFHD